MRASSNSAGRPGYVVQFMQSAAHLGSIVGHRCKSSSEVYLDTYLTLDMQDGVWVHTLSLNFIPASGVGVIQVQSHERPS